MNRRLQVIKYLLGDWMAASAAWVVLYIFRKKVPDRQVRLPHRAHF